MLLKSLDSFSVADANERCVDDVLKTSFKTLVDPLVEELNIIGVVLHNVTEAVLDVVFGTVHDITNFGKAKLWLDHPELSQMTRCVTLFSTESWSKCVYVTHATSIGLNIDLTRDS